MAVLLSGYEFDSSLSIVGLRQGTDGVNTHYAPMVHVDDLKIWQTNKQTKSRRKKKRQGR